MSNSTKLANSVIRELIELGVSNFVISPGSRNAPLLIALNEAADKQLVNLYVKIDERGAAFFALGIAKSTSNYVAVICTSGTAAANFHPAALEALHSNSKLLIITADRPDRLRGTGANQTTNQVGIYSAIKTHDLAASINLKPLFTAGPIHLNIQFDEPLLSSEKRDWLAGLKIEPVQYKNKISGKLDVTTGVLVIGHDRAGFTTGEINDFANKLNWPVIAEDPISFQQAHSHAALFLSDQRISETLAPENIVVIGRTTLSRSINNFIQLAKKLIVIDPRSTGVDSKRQADLILSHLPSEVVSIGADKKLWQQASEAAASEIKELKWSEQLAVITICSLQPNDTALFVGSSRPVRDIEAFVNARNGIDVFSNRGLAGIDGNISTVFGVASEYESTTAILGDLTLLHDISSLANASKDNLRIFVIDNNGGGIFSTLPQAGVDNFDQLFGTPHNLDLLKVVAGFGVSVSKVSDLTQLKAVATKPTKGLEVVIVAVPSRVENAMNLKEITQRVSSAVRIGINLA